MSPVRKARPTEGIRGWTVLTPDDAEAGFYAATDEHMERHGGDPPGLEWARKHSPAEAKSFTGEKSDQRERGETYGRRMVEANAAEMRKMRDDLTERLDGLHRDFVEGVVSVVKSFTEATGRRSSGKKPAQRLDPGSGQGTPRNRHTSDPVRELRDSAYNRSYDAGGEYARAEARAARQILSTPEKQRLHEAEVREFFRAVGTTGPPPGVPRNGRRAIT